MTENDCLFCKIVSGAIDAAVIYSNDEVVAFRDINPQAPTHILIVPRRHIATINDLNDDNRDDVSALYLAARDIAQEAGIADAGYRVTMNCNEAAGQTVFHLHLHLLGGRVFSWPPG